MYKSCLDPDLNKPTLIRQTFLRQLVISEHKLDTIGIKVILLDMDKRYCYNKYLLEIQTKLFLNKVLFRFALKYCRKKSEIEYR